MVRLVRRPESTTGGLLSQLQLVKQGMPSIRWQYDELKYIVQESSRLPCMRRRNANIWWIQSVYTHPEHRRKGLYSALFEHVKAAAHAQGAAGIRLYADEHNTRAQETYRKLGMTSHYRYFSYILYINVNIH